MTYTAKELIKEFWENKKEQYQNKYPDITEEQVIEICYNPFKFLSQVIKSGLFQSIRYTYLGVFHIPIFTAKRYERLLHTVSAERLHKTDERVTKDKVTVEKYIRNYKLEEDGEQEIELID